jgi:ABC-type sugar transport system ATPase subunit
VHDKPVNLWVAKFVGAYPINVISAYWQADQPEIRLFSEDGPSVTVGHRLAEEMIKAEIRGSFILGIRPQFVKVLPGGSPNGKLAGEVYTRQVLGTQILYILRSGEHELRSVVSSEHRFDLGEPVAIEFDWDNALVFDNDSEKCVIAGCEA